jgi:hypothetical protein
MPYPKQPARVEALELKAFRLTCSTKNNLIGFMDMKLFGMTTCTHVALKKTFIIIWLCHFKGVKQKLFLFMDRLPSRHEYPLVHIRVDLSATV